MWTVGPVGGQLRPPPGVCRCSLIRLTSHRGAVALPALLAPGLPTGTRPGGVGGRGMWEGAEPSPQAPLQFKVTHSGGYPLQRADSACPELLDPQPEPRRQDRGKGGPVRAGQAPNHGVGLLPCPLPRAGGNILPGSQLYIKVQSWGNHLPSLNLPAVLVYVQSSQKALSNGHV